MATMVTSVTMVPKVTYNILWVLSSYIAVRAIACIRCQSVSQSVSQSVGRSVGQPASQSVVGRSVSQSAGRRSVSQYVSISLIAFFLIVVGPHFN